MSQQGIFSIAPDGQAANTNGSQENGSGGNAANGNGSPFTAISNTPSQDSPFTQGQSPFQQVQSPDPGGRNGENAGGAGSRGIPQRRPDGQPSALGGPSSFSEGSAETEKAAVEQPQETNTFMAANVNAGGPFEMNGFPANAGSRVMEAAPVSAPVASPFVAVSSDHNNYEAAKAGLEPQQDFAAVQPQYTPLVSEQAQPAQESQPRQSYQATQTPQQAQADQPSYPVYSSQTQQQAPAPKPAFKQLELRAIFGVDHVLDVNQILQRARTLPGIRNVAVVGQQEASALSNFRQAMQGMGFGDSNDMKLNSGGGTIDFLSEQDATLAVLLEGAYAPGVQETLIIVAREIGKLA